MNMDISKEYHPESFEEYVNQKTAKEFAEGLIESKSPGSPLLLHGPYGVGKTTFAQIIAKELLDNPEANYKELDCSKLGSDVVEKALNKLKPKEMRKISECPRYDDFKVVLLDELHNVTSRSQQKLRKIIEEAEERHQIIIAVNDLESIEPAIRSRCVPIQFQPLSDSHIRKHLKEIIDEENLEVSTGKAERIVEQVDGDIRQALKRLEGITNVSS
ncbi:MAG: AAA family ATPase [Candidatus Nanohaloarchaea archaeon]